MLPLTVSPPSVTVAGDGIVALAIAIHLSTRGIPVTLLAPAVSGGASGASAGMLAPSVERAQGAAQSFSDAARDAWHRFASIVERAGGERFEILRGGIMRVARTADDAARLRETVRPRDVWLSPEAARERERELGAISGAVLYAGDGVVDVPAALKSVRAALARNANVRSIADSLDAIAPGKGGLVLRLAGGARLTTEMLVLAAGAWTPLVRGLPRAIPIRPVRGVLVAVPERLVTVPVYDAEGHSYVLPRGGQTLIGATADEAGFDVSAPDADADRLVESAARFVPRVASLPRVHASAGLRPVTPDGAALIGRDPAVRSLIYACGHGRNGFLQAPLTGEVVAALVAGEPVEHDLSPFDPTRFDTA